MSLLDVINSCDDSNDFVFSRDLMHLPSIESIINKSYDVKSKTLDELMEALTSYSYLNLDGKDVVEEILWILGENKEIFYKFFCFNGDYKSYLINDDPAINVGNINKVFKFELIKTIGKPPYSGTQLNVRFNDEILTEDCIKSNNLRLLSWGGENAKLVTKTKNLDMQPNNCLLTKKDHYLTLAFSEEIEHLEKTNTIKEKTNHIFDWLSKNM